jgi:hypothetical protein
MVGVVYHTPQWNLMRVVFITRLDMFGSCVFGCDERMTTEPPLFFACLPKLIMANLDRS